MKKLMIAAAALCASFAAQAYSVDWGYSEQTMLNPAGAQYHGGVDLTGSTLYVMDSATWDLLKVNADLALADIQGAAWNVSSDVPPVPGSAITSSEKGSAPNIMTTFNAGGTLSGHWDAAGSQALAFVLVNAGETGYAYAGTATGDVYDPNIPGSPKMAMVSVTYKDTPITGFTDFATVPEPTSGLLLLLGVAGLALRRRRA